jgi:thiol-disulfide isomerase/thioredoxin
MWQVSLSLTLLAGTFARGEDVSTVGALPTTEGGRKAAPEEPAKARASLERWYGLDKAASAALEAGKTDEARRDAEELLEGASGRKGNWNYGNAIHHGNIILGRIALGAGDVQKAKDHLIAAGKTPGSPQLGSFGPDLELAQQLLDKGEGKSTADYLRLVSKFCKPMKPRFDAWATAIDDGARPRLEPYTSSTPRDAELIKEMMEAYARAAAAVAKGQGGLQGSAKRPEDIGKPFELTFTDAISGNEVSVQKDLKGKIVVVDFWATWCPPCVRAMPEMKKLYTRYKSKGVEFIGVSLDVPEAEGGLAALKEFVSKNKIEWPQYHQGSGGLSKRWGITMIPTVFVIGADGKIASTDGRFTIEKLIPELIAKRDRGPAGATGKVREQRPATEGNPPETPAQ